MKKRFIPTLLFICIITHVSATNSIDSLYQSIKKEKQISKLPSLIAQYEKLVIDKKDWKELAKGYFLIGYKHNIFEELNESYNYYLASINYAKKVNDELRIIKAEINLGSIHFDSFEYEMAFKYFKRALSSSKNIGNKLQTAMASQGIGQSLRKMQKRDEAIGYYYDAHEIYSNLNYKQLASEMYIEIGLCFKEEGLYEEANEFYYKAINENSSSDNIRARVLNNDANIKWIKGDSAIAIQKAAEALALKRKIGNTNLIVSSLNNLGSFYFEFKKYNQALPLFIEAFKINNKYEYYGSMAIELLETIKYLDKLEEFLGSTALVVNDELNKKSRRLNIKLLERLIILEPKGRQSELRWAREAKEKLIIKEENRRILFLSGILFLILTLLGYYIYTRHKTLNKKELRRKENLDEIMQRHFIKD